MDNYKLQVRQFMSEWEQMQSALSVSHSVLETGGRSPQDLLEEMVHQMESECHPLNSQTTNDSPEFSHNGNLKSHKEN